MSRLFEDCGLVVKVRNEHGYEVYDYSSLLANILEYNLIGLDYGDGELSAYKVKITRDPNAKCGYRVEITPLRFDNTGRCFRPPTTFYRYKNNNENGEPTGEWVYELLLDGSVKRAQDLGAEVYSNYKRCPGTTAAREHYEFEDGTQSDMTYEEVMAKGFDLVFNEMVKQNGIDTKKRTIVLVGCPSSKAWIGKEREYARLLKNGINYPEGFSASNVCVAIHKESNAAMAQAMNLLGVGGNMAIRPGEITIIIDNGSSTFDITIVGVNGIAANGEDSYQFGGNTLDENLMRLIKRELARRGLTIRNTSGHKIGIRKKKEAYYGIYGVDQEEQTYVLNALKADGKTVEVKVHLQDMAGVGEGNEKNIHIGMKEALDGVLCSAFHLVAVGGSVIPHVVGGKDGQPWLDMCRTIYTELYDRNHEQFTRIVNGRCVPHHLILCGGVSIMPEVRKIAEEVFGCSAATADAPNFTVSKGLANVLGVEVIKTLLLKNIEDDVKELCRGEKDAFRDKFVQIGLEDMCRVMDETMKAWSEAEANESINDWWNRRFIVKYKALDYRLDLKEAARYVYYQSLMGKINACLKNEFERLFPGYVQQFEPPMKQDLQFENLNLPAEITYITSYGATEYKKAIFSQKLQQDVEDESNRDIYTRLTKSRDKAWREAAYRNIRNDNRIRRAVINNEERTLTLQYKHTTVLGGVRIKTEDVSAAPPSVKGTVKRQLTDEFTEELLDIVFEEIRPKLADFVEQITPYFVM